MIDYEEQVFITWIKANIYCFICQVFLQEQDTWQKYSYHRYTSQHIHNLRSKKIIFQNNRIKYLEIGYTRKNVLHKIIDI